MDRTAYIEPLPNNPAPHIALILPLESPAFAEVAEVVHQGFIAAATVQQGLPVRIYPCSDEASEVVSLYQHAVANGALAVVGPITRNGVSTLAEYPNISVPTLALNTAETLSNSYNFYYFGLSVENEARQIAHLAAAAGLHDATVINTGTVISQRLAAAFTEEWLLSGGVINAQVHFDGDFSVLTNLPVAPWPEGMEPQPASAVSDTGEPLPPTRPILPPIAPGNIVFLAAAHNKARLIRPYLNPSIPVYGTSQLFIGNANKLDSYDLNDVRFVDMPWLLQPDHPAVMIYPRADTPLSPEMDRFYALGIDAYRLVYKLLYDHAGNNSALDGVTGRIVLDRQQFQREGIPAYFRQGLGLTPEMLYALNTAKAQAKAEAAAAASAPKSIEPENAVPPPAQ